MGTRSMPGAGGASRLLVLAAIGLGASAIALSGPAAAAALSFAEALALADEAPVVAAARTSANVKRAVDAHVSRLPYNPQLGAQAGYRRELSGGGVDVLLSVAQSFNLSGYGAARRRSIRAEEETLAAEVEHTRLRQRLQCARSWTSLWGAAAALREAQSEISLMSEFVAKIERGAQAGALIQVDVAEARAYLTEVRLQALTVEGEAFELGLELARSIGRAGQTPLLPAGPLPEPALPELSPRLRARLLAQAEELPEARLPALAAQSERLRADEAKAQHGAQLALGAQWMHEPTAPHTILGTVSLQLPIFDHGERDRADFLAGAERLRGAAADARTAAQTELLSALHELEHSREIWTHLNASMLPATAANLQLRERLLQAGEGTVLEVLLARRSLAAARARAARAQAVHSFSRYKLWLYLQQLGVVDAAVDGSAAVGP